MRRPIRPLATLVLSAIAAIAVLGACAAPPKPETVPVTVLAIAGPTCPVERTPPDPGCGDRPIEGARMVFRTLDGEPVVTITTGEDGMAAVALPAGRYVVEPQPVEGLMGTPEPFEVELVPRAGGVAVELVVRYDTGIR